MDVLRTIEDVRRNASGWRRDGLRAGLVPTMGALHDGHLTLVDHARGACDRTIATLFVNPLQFGPSEDFDAYPRTEQRDLELLRARGCDAAFAPSTRELYPAGPPTPGVFLTTVQVARMSDRLCGGFRPGHFAGVTTIVMKLFNIVMPDAAFFGEKDFQQLQIIRRMVADLNVPVEIVGVPTVREADGLAMSSRNQYLTPAERAIAPALYAALDRVRLEMREGLHADAALDRARRALVEKGFTVDYVSVVSPDTLEPVAKPVPGGRVLAAARLGRTRLIDNVQI